jgi:hypothetical protein
MALALPRMRRPLLRAPAPSTLRNRHATTRPSRSRCRFGEAGRPRHSGHTGPPTSGGLNRPNRPTVRSRAFQRHYWRTVAGRLQTIRLNRPTHRPRLNHCFRLISDGRTIRTMAADAIDVTGRSEAGSVAPYSRGRYGSTPQWVPVAAEAGRPWPPPPMIRGLPAPCNRDLRVNE